MLKVMASFGGMLASWKCKLLKKASIFTTVLVIAGSKIPLFGGYTIRSIVAEYAGSLEEVGEIVRELKLSKSLRLVVSFVSSSVVKTQYILFKFLTAIFASKSNLPSTIR